MLSAIFSIKLVGFNSDGAIVKKINLFWIFLLPFAASFVLSNNVKGILWSSCYGSAVYAVACQVSKNLHWSTFLLCFVHANLYLLCKLQMKRILSLECQSEFRIVVVVAFRSLTNRVAWLVLLLIIIFQHCLIINVPYREWKDFD